MAEEALYVGCNGHVAGISVAEGTELWRTKLSTDELLASTSYQDVCLLEHEGRIYAGSSGYLFCLDAASGQIFWRNDLKGLGHNEVTLAMRGKSVQLVSRSSTHS